MSNQSILEKAIKKAIDNGWLLEPDDGKLESIKYSSEFQGERDCWWLTTRTDEKHGKWIPIGNDTDIIFNHDFAKALWGEKGIKELFTDHDDILWASYEHVWFLGKNWQYHLQMMVVADDPIEYLGEHLE